MRLAIRVPASSANLGPGFDCFGLALDLCNEVVADTAPPPSVSWTGEGADELPVDGTDLVSRTMAAVAGAASASLPPIALRGENRIPFERGLGSSSAATVAGVALARRLLGLSTDPVDVFADTARIEGHPDNAAPAVYGGFTIALPEGPVRRFDPHPDLRPVVLIPSTRLLTAEARRVLPGDVPREDAVFNAAHAALTAAAITSDPSLLSLALRDRLHEDARLALVPPVAEVMRSLRDAGVPACVSGAGPALLAFPDGPIEPPDGWRVLEPGVRAAGFELEEG